MTQKLAIDNLEFFINMFLKINNMQLKVLKFNKIKVVLTAL